MSAGIAEAAISATDTIVTMFRAIERGDLESFRACFAPGAAVWHNADGIVQGLDEVCVALAGLRDASTSVAYKDQRIVRAGNESFVQHILSAQLKSGAALTLPAMMRIETNDEGLIARIEEYYDSRATDCLG